MRLTIITLASCLLLNPVWAQEKPEGSTKPEASAPISEDAKTAAPYDDKLLRLSEVLGSIHYLRALCGAGEGGKWRGWMADILAAEKPNDGRKARLVARFNRGFKAFDQTYTTCTPSALLAADRYVKEGVRLSSQITNRYGR